MQITPRSVKMGIENSNLYSEYDAEHIWYKGNHVTLKKLMEMADANGKTITFSLEDVTTGKITREEWQEISCLPLNPIIIYHQNNNLYLKYARTPEIIYQSSFHFTDENKKIVGFRFKVGDTI